MLALDTPENGTLTTPAGISEHVTRRRSPAVRGASFAFSGSATASSLNNKNCCNDVVGTPAESSYIGLNGQTQNLKPPGEQSSSLGGLSAPRKTPVSKKSVSLQDAQQFPNHNAERIARQSSPSFMAAQLAASRATPTSPDVDPSNAANSRRPPLSQRTSSLQVPEAGQDDGALVHTKSLVQLYESKQPSKPPEGEIQSVRYGTRKPPPVVSPKPVRPLVRSKTSSSGLPVNAATSLPSGQPAPPSTRTNVSHLGAVAAASRLAGPALGASTKKQLDVPEPPPPRRSKRAMDGTQDVPPPTPSTLTASQEASAKSTLQVPVDSSSLRKEVPRKPSISKQQSDSTIETIPVSKPRLPPRVSSTHNLEKPKTPSTSASSPRPAPRFTQKSDTYIPQLTVNSLANAMVASSLASSRAPSPTKPPLPPPRRHAGGGVGGGGGGGGSLFHRTNHSATELASRTPSPGKAGLRQTMRKPLSSDEEAASGGPAGEYVMRKSGHLGMRMHPNKHHEGDRKRYRTQVTEKERKRYEGVWASNRGLHVPASVGPEAKDVVLNIVVRDIWRRSRLSDEVLAEVWELVNLKGGAWLRREEFVVGMWLIDQRLKGSKLPVKVSDSVWTSVRRLAGLQLPVGR